jgi:energy-coupling factor transporter transmembrane protein EcfT
VKVFYSILTFLLISVAILALVGGMSEATGAPQEAVVCAFACFVAILARIAQAAAHHADNQEKGAAFDPEEEANSLSIPNGENEGKRAAFDPEEEANSLSIPNGENEGKGAWLVLILVVIIIGCLIFFDYL